MPVLVARARARANSAQSKPLRAPVRLLSPFLHLAGFAQKPIVCLLCCCARWEQSGKRERSRQDMGEMLQLVSETLSLTRRLCQSGETGPASIAAHAWPTLFVRSPQFLQLAAFSRAAAQTETRVFFSLAAKQMACAEKKISSQTTQKSDPF